MANIVEIILRGTDQANAAFGRATRSMKDFQTASLAVTKAVAGFAAIGAGAIAGLTVKAINAADEIGKAAQQTGFAVTEFSKLANAADLADVDLTSLKTGLVQFNKAILEAASNITSQQNRALQAMGISIRDANGGLKENSVLLREAADAFAGYADGAEKTALATQLFGRTGADLIPLLNLGTQGIEELGSSSMVVTEQMAKDADTIDDNTKILKKAFLDIGNVILRDLGPQLAQLSAWLVKIQKEGNAMGESAKFIVGAIVALARGLGVISFVLQQVWTEAHALAELLAATVTEAVFAVIDAFKLLGTALAGVGQAFRQFFTGEFRTGIKTAKDALAAFGPDVMARMREANQGIVAEATDIFDQMEAELEKRRKDFDALLQGILEAENVAPQTVEAPLNVQRPVETRPSAPIVEETGAQAALNEVLKERQQILADIELLQDTQHSKQIAQLAELQGFHQTFSNVVQTAHAGWLTFLSITSQGVMTGLGAAVASIATGAQKAGEAFKQLGKQMIAMIVNFMAQKAIAFALEKILAAASRGLQVAAVAATSAAAAATASAWAPAATAALIATLGGASAASASLVPLMAANAAAASSLALASSVFAGAAHGGLDFVPQESTFLLRRGERVVQPEANRDLTEFLAGGGGGGMMQVSVYLDGSVLASGIGELSRDGRLQIDARAIV